MIATFLSTQNLIRLLPFCCLGKVYFNLLCGKTNMFSERQNFPEGSSHSEYNNVDGTVEYYQ